MTRPQIHVGTSGWTYDDWTPAFYPVAVRGAERLDFYAERFDTVEVNASFYRVPTPSMVAAWNRRLPTGFHLVLKGNRAITHRRRIADCDAQLEFFFARALQVERLRVVLWQLPPSLRADPARLDRFLGTLPDRVRHAVEFRHASWWNDDRTADVLSRHRAAFVAISHPELPADIVPTTDILYVRFHGVDALYEHRYSRAQLSEWSRRLGPHLPGRALYAFFNNDRHARAPLDATVFRALLDRT